MVTSSSDFLLPLTLDFHLTIKNLAVFSNQNAEPFSTVCFGHSLNPDRAFSLLKVMNDQRRKLRQLPSIHQLSQQCFQQSWLHFDRSLLVPISMNSRGLRLTHRKGFVRCSAKHKFRDEALWRLSFDRLVLRRLE